MSKRITAIVLVAVAITASAGMIISLNNSMSSAEYSLDYYDGDDLIETHRHKGIHMLKGFDDRFEKTDRTIYGWCHDPSGKGEILRVGDIFTVEEGRSLYAIAVEGRLQSDGRGIVDFKMPSVSAMGSVDIDLRFEEDVDTLRICTDTVNSMISSASGMTILMPNGDRYAFDAQTVRGFDDIVDSEPLSVKVSRMDMNYSIIVSSGDMTEDTVDGEIHVDLSDYGFDEDSLITVRSASDSDLHAEVSSGGISFSMREFGFSVNQLFGITIMDVKGKGLDPTDDDRFEFTVVSSGTYKEYGKFSSGDRFKLTGSSNLVWFNVKGATPSDDGIYVVTGDSSVSIIMEVGTPRYKIVLPSDQIGYTISTDKDEVEESQRAILTYRLLAGYTDLDLMVTVNGKSFNPDSSSRIYLSDVGSDQIVKVTGVYDKRKYDIKVPSDQTGYTLTSSVSTLHHGQSYILTLILESDYVKGPDFSMTVNGDVVDISSGTATMDKVSANQIVAIKGVEMRSFKVIPGEHILLLVDGYKVSSVTSKDIMTIGFDSGYSMPSSFDSHLPDSVSVVEGGYSVTADTVFPSIYRLTAGDNVRINGDQTKVVFCPGDSFTVDAINDHKLPSGYAGLTGATVSEGKYRYNSDADLPAVYSMKYYREADLWKELFVTEGEVTMINDMPSRTGYEFTGWNKKIVSINNDVSIKAVWNPCVYSVKFGKNITYTIDGEKYTSPGEYNLTNENKIVVTHTNASLKDYYPVNSTKVGNEYHIFGNTVFQSIFEVRYSLDATHIVSEYYAEGYVILLKNPNAIFNTNDDTKSFKAWLNNGNKMNNKITVNEDYYLVPLWE